MSESDEMKDDNDDDDGSDLSRMIFLCMEMRHICMYKL